MIAINLQVIMLMIMKMCYSDCDNASYDAGYSGDVHYYDNDIGFNEKECQY